MTGPADARHPKDRTMSLGTPPPPESSRRRFPRPRRRWLRRLLLVAVIASLVIGAAIAGTGAWLYSRARTDTVGDLTFEQPLHIPPVLEPETDADGRKVFRLRLQTGTTELVPGRQTETWGANGTYLGPTLRASRGDEVAVHVDNDLPESTTLHWHGMHLPAAADGNPHQPIEPGATWSPSWEIDQPAATLWYHPHPHGETADHIYRGVAGLFLLDDESPPPGLPDEYGINDIPVILQDKRFHGDGSLDMGEPLFSNVGQLGDHILVNGTSNPHVEITHERVRLRVLNASNGRVYNLGFDDDRSFELVGSDGGLLPRAHTTNRVQVSPGERVEIVARFRPGERPVLRSYPPELGADSFGGRFAGGDDRFDLLEMRAAAQLIPSAQLPEQLGTDDLPDASEAVTTRTFELNGSSRINGDTMDMNRIDTVVAVDTTEIWEVTNQSGRPHNFHVHDVQFRVLEHDGAPPPPELAGPKDTVFLPPRSTARLALRFEDYTDPTVPYMYHCHLLAHEDAGMMAQFTVVDPDEVDTAPRTVGADGRHQH